MEARLLRAALLAATIASLGASYRTQNFIVSAPSAELAREVATAAENYRRDLAIEWIDRELPPWPHPCPITVHVGEHLGAGGATSFMFDNGQPFGWTMTIQGSRARLLDSVLPHEITHTVFATHFGRPLPRWADEGACTTVEHNSERAKQDGLLISFLTSGRGIAFNRMFAMSEYPSDVLPLYAQGYSLARFLIAQGGKRTFIDYVGDGMARNDWTNATQKHYGYKDLSELQVTWLDWVRRGSPALASPRPETLIAQPTEPARDDMVSAPAEPARGTVADAPQPSANHLAGSVAAAHGGWYQRVRDQAVAARGAANRAQGASSEPFRAPRGQADISQAVSRPQGVSPPEQMLLETTPVPPHAAPAAPFAAPPGLRSPTASPSWYLAPTPTGTMWR